MLKRPGYWAFAPVFCAFLRLSNSQEASALTVSQELSQQTGQVDNQQSCGEE
jgi:hypothetical protein